MRELTESQPEGQSAGKSWRERFVWVESNGAAGIEEEHKEIGVQRKEVIGEVGAGDGGGTGR